MSTLNTNELNEWLRIDNSDDENTLNSLIQASTLIIEQSTGVTLADVSDNQQAEELYKTLQKFIITDLYENREGGNISPAIVSLYAQLEAYKLNATEDTST